MIRLFLMALVASLLPGAALAESPLAFENQVFVERTSVDANGKHRVTLEPPNVVVPGDQLVFVLGYRNAGPTAASRFVVTNPLPAAVAFQGAGDDQATVSVDGGRSWGRLSTLTVPVATGGRRPALPADVTHVRWAFAQPVPAGSSGKLMFRGIVK